MILNERDARHEHVLQVARQMMTAARTAPKGKGIDIIEVALITDEEIKQLSDTMIAMVEEHGMNIFPSTILISPTLRYSGASMGFVSYPLRVSCCFFTSFSIRASFSQCRCCCLQ